MTAPAWTPEREISLSAATSLLRSRFPVLAQADVQSFAQGWDNTAFLVRPEQGPELVFRFPRRAIALAGIRRELAWLPLLAPQLPLPIPVPTFRGEWGPATTASSDEPPWPYWGGKLLAGTELAIRVPDPAQRLPIAGQLGEFLRILHGLEPSRPGLTGLPLDPNHRADPGHRAIGTTGCLARLADQGLDAPLDAARELVSQAALLPAPSGDAVICHGDLHARHVLLAEDLAISGIIDWGDLCVADPAVDLSIAFGTFEGPARQAFFASYGPIDAERELRARALAVSLNALLAEYALAPQPNGERSFLNEVTAGIRRAIADQR